MGCPNVSLAQYTVANECTMAHRLIKSATLLQLLIWCGQLGMVLCDVCRIRNHQIWLISPGGSRLTVLSRPQLDIRTDALGTWGGGRGEAGLGATQSFQSHTSHVLFLIEVQLPLKAARWRRSGSVRGLDGSASGRGLLEHRCLAHAHHPLLLSSSFPHVSLLRVHGGGSSSSWTERHETLIASEVGGPRPLWDAGHACDQVHLPLGPSLLHLHHLTLGGSRGWVPGRNVDVVERGAAPPVLHDAWGGLLIRVKAEDVRGEEEETNVYLDWQTSRCARHTNQCLPLFLFQPPKLSETLCTAPTR